MQTPTPTSASQIKTPRDFIKYWNSTEMYTEDPNRIDLYIPNPKKVFNDIILETLYDYENRVEVHYGGASSGKSHGIYQKMILKALGEWRKPRRIMVMRKVGATVKDSSFQHIKEILYDFSLLDDCKINRGDYTIELPNKSIIMFKGLDDPEKIKSIKGISDIVMEEASEFTLEDFTQLNLRLRDKDHTYKQIYVLFNPVSKRNWVYKYFFEIDSGAKIYKTTYKDNRFLDSITKTELEALRHRNPTYYRIYALGEFATLDKLVFPEYDCRIIPEEEVKELPLLVGLDFGYVNDPSALICVRYNRPKKKIYITSEYTKKGMLNDEIAKRIIELGLHKEKIFADSAEAKSIVEIKRLGVDRIVPVQKGADSVRQGIQWILQHELIVDERCFSTQKELENYTFKKDKYGEYTNEPQDSYNHLIDSLRYALSEEIRAGNNLQFFSTLGF